MQMTRNFQVVYLNFLNCDFSELDCANVGLCLVWMYGLKSRVAFLEKMLLNLVLLLLLILDSTFMPMISLARLESNVSQAKIWKYVRCGGSARRVQCVIIFCEKEEFISESFNAKRSQNLYGWKTFAVRMIISVPKMAKAASDWRRIWTKR